MTGPDSRGRLSHIQLALRRVALPEPAQSRILDGLKLKQPDRWQRRTAFCSEDGRRTDRVFTRKPRFASIQLRKRSWRALPYSQALSLAPARADDLPNGTEVILRIGTDVIDDDGTVPPEEIARVLVAMGRMQPLDFPDDVAAELDFWERKLNEHGIDDANRRRDAFR